MIVTLTERSSHPHLARLVAGQVCPQGFFRSGFLDVLLLTESTRGAGSVSPRLGWIPFRGAGMDLIPKSRHPQPVAPSKKAAERPLCTITWRPCQSWVVTGQGEFVQSPKRCK